MKKIIESFGTLLAVAFTALLLLPASAFGQVDATYWRDFPTTPISTPAGVQLLHTPMSGYGGVSWAAAATVTTTNATAIPLRADRGIALLATVSGEAAANGVFTFNFQTSFDKTNWTTIAPIPFGVQMSTTNLITRYTNVPPDVLNNARWLRLGSLVNGDAAKTAGVWRLQYSWFNE